MQMPRIRFTVRRMMVAVLLVAMLLSGEQMRRTRQYRLLKAKELRQEERDWRRALPQLKRQLAEGRDANPRFARLSERQLRRELAAIRDVHENHRLWAEYSLSLSRWYERGAGRPWERLGEEPPIPREIDGTPR